jgi:hypothetical protein
LWRRRTARALAAEFCERVSLANEACKFRERIVAGRLGRTTHGRFTCTIRSLALVVRHSVPGY